MPDVVDLQYDNYNRAGILSKYSRDEGLLVIPVMGPAGTAPILVRTHAPYGVREVNFEYAKQGSPPLMPALEDTQTGDIFLGSTLEFPAPAVDQQKNLVYGARGSYKYVQPLGGRKQGDGFPIDAYPFPTPIDTLGELVPYFSDPDLLTVDGQWTKESVDTSILTSSSMIG